MSKSNEIWFPWLKCSALKVLSLSLFEIFARKTCSIWVGAKIMGTHLQIQFSQNWPGWHILKQCLLDLWESGLSNGVRHVSWHFEISSSWNNQGVWRSNRTSINLTSARSAVHKNVRFLACNFELYKQAIQKILSLQN